VLGVLGGMRAIVEPDRPVGAAVETIETIAEPLGGHRIDDLRDA
jgi:hypothetical protein